MVPFIAVGRARAARARFAGRHLLRLATLRARIAANSAREREEFWAVIGASDDELARVSAARMADAVERVRWDARVALRNGRIR